MTRHKKQHKTLFYSLRLLICILVVSISSCNTDDDSDVIDDCVFEQIDAKMDGRIDPTETSIMEYCIQNQYVSKEAIEDNLIGDWLLIGFGHGWFHTPSHPCASLSFSRDNLIFKYEDKNRKEESQHSWEINVSTNGSFFLIVEPRIQGFGINKFCPEYMFGNFTPTDGNMFLYEKIQ